MSTPGPHTTEGVALTRPVVVVLRVVGGGAEAGPSRPPGSRAGTPRLRKEGVGGGSVHVTSVPGAHYGLRNLYWELNLLLQQVLYTSVSRPRSLLPPSPRVSTCLRRSAGVRVTSLRVGSEHGRLVQWEAQQGNHSPATHDVFTIGVESLGVEGREGNGQGRLPHPHFIRHYTLDPTPCVPSRPRLCRAP